MQQIVDILVATRWTHPWVWATVQHR